MREYPTYYTRPMSPPWSKPLDVDRLADGEADIDFAVPLAALPRVRSQLAREDGEVRGHVRFAREAGFVVADMTMSGAVWLTCQRCLDAMSETLTSQVRMALVAAEADTSRVPEDLEPVLAREGRVSIAELVEEELLLSWPIVPAHAEDVNCAVSPGNRLPAQEPREEAKTQKPFAALGELLKR